MPLTAGVDSAGEVFASLFVDFQVVGDVIALRPISKDQAIRRMVKPKVFHAVPPRYVRRGYHALGTPQRARFHLWAQRLCCRFERLGRSPALTFQR
jgi:hypothetical protein